MRRKREIFVGISILAIATLAFIFGWTNLFTVKSVEVTGSPNSQISKQVLQIAEIQVGEKLARVEPRNISTKLALAGIDWVENVKVNRNWLTRKVTINLAPRTPVAKSGSRYVDSGGVIFTSPILLGKNLANVDAQSSTSRAAAIALYLAMPIEIRAKITQITATSTDNFQFKLSDNLLLIWGSDSNMSVKVKIYRALIALPENKKISHMDLSDPTKPTVK